jgi:sugar phosphate isomerase/epimerase
MAIREIGIAHLTLLGLTPPELVSTAAEAGYDFVGVRVVAATKGETPYPMQPGSPMSKETITRLADTGLHVRDIEFLSLDENADADYWLPALEAGAALGASSVSVVGADSDLGRLADTLARLTADAHRFGIVPTLEPISYQVIRSIHDAARLARNAGAAVLVDSLHVQRFGGSIDEVRALEPELVPILQICDAPLRVPEHLDAPVSMPLGMTTNGSVLQLEARALRMIPGTGELPLRELIDAVPADTPLSVEVPNGTISVTMSAVDYARLNREAVDALLVRRASPHERDKPEQER